MNRDIREASPQWDDVPAKVVGRRSQARGFEPGMQLQALANRMGAGRVTWPKGVFRFHSHEEADAWWINEMMVKR